MIPYYEKYIRLIKGPIKKALKEGYHREEIESKLKEKKWPRDIVEEAFKASLKEHKLDKAKLLISLLFWLGLLTLLSSLFAKDFYIYPIITGIILMLFSMLLKLSARKAGKPKPISQVPLQSTLKPTLLPQLPPLQQKPVASQIIQKAKKESFFSRLFGKKEKVEKKIEAKPVIPKPASKIVEKTLKVKKPAAKKSPLLAAILSLVIPGLGQMYLGKLKKGIIFLLTFWLIIPWIYSIIDAYNLASEMNKKIQSMPDIKKPGKEEKKKEKKKSHFGLYILFFISLLLLASIFWLRTSYPRFTIYNAITYSSIVIIITLILIPVVRRKAKKEKKKEEKEKFKEVKMEELRKEVTQKQTEYETDFDKLHKMVEKYGRIKIADVAETFKISKTEAEEWASILEQHNLASIYYPAIGGPEIVRKKKEKKEEE